MVLRFNLRDMIFYKIKKPADNLSTGRTLRGTTRIHSDNPNTLKGQKSPFPVTWERRRALLISHAKLRDYFHLAHAAAISAPAALWMQFAEVLLPIIAFDLYYIILYHCGYPLSSKKAIKILCFYKMSFVFLIYKSVFHKISELLREISKF